MDRESFIMGVYVGQRLGRWRNYNIVRWLNGDGSVLDEKTYRLGEPEPTTYKVPSKDSEEGTLYAFAGWSEPERKRNVTTYYPLFAEYKENEFLFVAAEEVFVYIDFKYDTAGKIDWDDGTTSQITGTTSSPRDIHHTFRSEGDHIVRISGIISFLKFQYRVSSAPNNYGLKAILTPFPATLDDPVSKQSFSYCFLRCTNLTYVPERLFSNCPKCATSFVSCFEYCVSLEYVPGSIFERCSECSSFLACFRFCYKFKIAAYGLFSDCSKATSFEQCFRLCKKLSYIEGSLFSENSEATNFNYCFWECESLEEIPRFLFFGCIKAETFSGTFAQTSILNIPHDLFFMNQNAADFSECFYGTKISNIPGGLFDNNVNAVNFANTFHDCKELQYVPFNLFDSIRRIDYIYYCFSGDSAISSSVPNLWIKFSDSNHTYCYLGCTNAANYSEIPQDWK